MTTKLSSKGQVVLPKNARTRLRLRPGMTFMCKVQGGAIVLTPESVPIERPRLEADPKTGLLITKSPGGITVTSEDVHAAMLDFP